MHPALATTVDPRARVFHQSPLFRVFHSHYSRFQEIYALSFQADLGLFRDAVDHTVDRFLVCGDPREGVAVYTCEPCGTRKVVPFSCKTRLFCPTCHYKRVVLWGEDLWENLLLSVPHRFWTFTIPKRLRYFFLRNRKLFKHLTQAAKETFDVALGCDANPKIRPALIILIQTHGDELNWHSHLHIVATDGGFDISNPANLRYQPRGYWDVDKMAEIFRLRLLSKLHEAGVLTDDDATNMMSWPHSGFHVHGSEPFHPEDKEPFLRRLAYAFRVPVTLGQLSCSQGQVRLTTKKGKTLSFSPTDFIAKLTQHIPDRYQHCRVYGGLYASATRRFLKLPCMKEASVNTDKKRSPPWARLLAKLFSDIPTLCPLCHQEMKLTGIEMRMSVIQVWIPSCIRAPPKKPFTSFQNLHAGQPIYLAAEEATHYGQRTEFSQARRESNEDFDQTISW